MKARPLKASIWFGGSVLIMVSAAIATLFPQKSFLAGVNFDPGNSSAGHEQLAGEGAVINWQLLQSFDYQQVPPQGGELVVPAALQDKLHRKVRLPGFAVPLSTDFSSVDELLFVPNELACIHVPAPPPHLVVYVKLRHGATMDELSGPLWLEGILTIKKTDSIYGAAAFEMDGLAIRPYQS